MVKLILPQGLGYDESLSGEERVKLVEVIAEGISQSYRQAKDSFALNAGREIMLKQRGVSPSQFYAEEQFLDENGEKSLFVVRDPNSEDFKAKLVRKSFEQAFRDVKVKDVVRQGLILANQGSVEVNGFKDALREVRRDVKEFFSIVRQGLEELIEERRKIGERKNRVGIFDLLRPYATPLLATGFALAFFPGVVNAQGNSLQGKATVQDTIQKNIVVVHQCFNPNGTVLHGPFTYQQMAVYIGACPDSAIIEVSQIPPGFERNGVVVYNKLISVGLNNTKRDTVLVPFVFPIYGIPPELQQAVFGRPDSLPYNVVGSGVLAPGQDAVTIPITIVNVQEQVRRPKHSFNVPYDSGVLRLSSLEDIVAQAYIYDVTGRVVRAVKGAKDVNVSDLPQGKYLLVVRTKKGGKLTGKFINVGGQFRVNLDDNSQGSLRNGNSRLNSEKDERNYVRIFGNADVNDFVLHGGGLGIHIKFTNNPGENKCVPTFPKMGYSVFGRDSLQIYYSGIAPQADTIFVISYCGDINGNIMFENYDSTGINIDTVNIFDPVDWLAVNVLGGFPLMWGNNDVTNYSYGLNRTAIDSMKIHTSMPLQDRQALIDIMIQRALPYIQLFLPEIAPFFVNLSVNDTTSNPAGEYGEILFKGDSPYGNCTAYTSLSFAFRDLNIFEEGLGYTSAIQGYKNLYNCVATDEDDAIDQFAFHETYGRFVSLETQGETVIKALPYPFLRSVSGQGRPGEDDLNGNYSPHYLSEYDGLASIIARENMVRGLKIELAAKGYNLYVSPLANQHFFWPNNKSIIIVAPDGFFPEVLFPPGTYKDTITVWERYRGNRTYALEMIPADSVEIRNDLLPGTGIGDPPP